MNTQSKKTPENWVEKYPVKSKWTNTDGIECSVIGHVPHPNCEEKSWSSVKTSVWVKNKTGELWLIPADAKIMLQERIK